MHMVGTPSIIWLALRPPFVLFLLTTCHPSSRNSLLHCGLGLSLFVHAATHQLAAAYKPCCLLCRVG